MSRSALLCGLLLAGCGRLGFSSPPDEVNSLADASGECIAASSDLVAWYPLDETGAGRVSDSGPNGLDVVCSPANCPTATAGTIAGAQLFDGSVPTHLGAEDPAAVSAAFPDGSSFSIAVWVRIDEMPRSQAFTIVSKRVGTGDFNSFQLGVSQTNDAIFLVSDTTNRRERSLNTEVLAPLDEWIHITATYDAATTTRELWQGTELLIRDELPSGVNFDQGVFVIGADFDAPAEYNDGFVGAIDELRIYSAALSESRIAEIVGCR